MPQSPLSKRNCFLCGAPQEPAFEGIKDFEYETCPPVNFSACKECRLLSQAPLPAAAALPSFYPAEYRNYLPFQLTIFSTLKEFQFQWLVRKILRHFGAGKELKILEIGFGNGRLLSALKEKGYGHLYGADFTDRNFANLKDSGITLKAQDLEKGFPFDERFDVILLNNVLEHFLDPEAVLKNCRDHLTESGKIILITPSAAALDFFLFKKYWAGFHAPRHIHLFDDKNIAQLGEKLGFADVALRPLADPGQFALSIQNFLQDQPLTKTKLKNGMAWYLPFLILAISPWVFFQNFLGCSTSLLCVYSHVRNLRLPS